MRDAATQRMAPKVRLRLLSFSTADMLAAELSRALAQTGIDAEIACGNFGVVLPELLAPSQDARESLIIVMDARGFFNRNWRQTTAAAHRLLTQTSEALFTALEGLAASSSCNIFINSLSSPAIPQAGYLDLSHQDGASYLVHHFNHRLREVAARSARIVLIDADQAMAGIAPIHRSDPKLWFYGRIPYSAQASKALAQAIGQAIAAQCVPQVKVLALDLDDTLWRGIYGEQGSEGLQCGDDFPGNAFKALQEECLRLKSQGLLLTILSKNDADVLRVFDEHPGMSLKRDDFAAYRINWAPKADNIRALAKELSLGLETFLFLDDSPHERDAMRWLAPEVCTPDLPSDPARRPDFLRAYRPLWPTRLTSADRERTELYAVQAKARALRGQAAGLEDYLAGLEQALEVEHATAASLSRIAQMHARTNQFNLTTQRLSETDLAGMLADEGHSVLQGRLTDKFGDHGVVICAAVKLVGRRACIQSFLMSCRVIGREVELAFLGAVLGYLCTRGIDEVEARYVPTKKNGPAEHFYRHAGLTVAPSTGAPGQTWIWKKNGCALPGSQFIKVGGRVPQTATP
jgi:FkbH-like protein